MKETKKEVAVRQEQIKEDVKKHYGGLITGEKGDKLLFSWTPDRR